MRLFLNRTRKRSKGTKEQGVCLINANKEVKIFLAQDESTHGCTGEDIRITQDKSVMANDKNLRLNQLINLKSTYGLSWLGSSLHR